MSVEYLVSYDDHPAWFAVNVRTLGGARMVAVKRFAGARRVHVGERNCDECAVRPLTSRDLTIEGALWVPYQKEP